MNLIYLFTILSIANVIIQTIKSIATIKGSKMIAALINAIAYGLYTFVIIYTNCELNIWLKAGITAAANFVGVYVVKYFEEKARKDKLWKIECAITCPQALTVCSYLDDNKIPYFNLHIGDGKDEFVIFSKTQEDSKKIGNLLKQNNATYFVTEQSGVL